VPPGDKGEITATFNIGDRTGSQVKTVTVENRRGDKSENGAHAKGGNSTATRDHPEFVFGSRRQTGHEGRLM
jgi:hypothetical protein